MPAIAGFVFDLDGCLFRGRAAIPGAGEALAALRRQGMAVAFLTNDSSLTPAGMAAKLAGMGVAARADEVVTAATVTADYITATYPGRRIFAVCSPGLDAAFKERAVELLPQDAAESAEVVVIGRDEEFTFAKLAAACRAVWAGATLVGTNYDPLMPVEDGFMPATGPLIKAVAYATGVEPIITGKPSAWAAQSSLAAVGTPADRTVMVGDQPAQDMAVGKAAGMRTVLVLSGSTAPHAVDKIPPELRPDAVLPDVTHLPAWLAGEVWA